MFSIVDLRKAVIAGQHAHVKKIAYELKSRNIDFSNVVDFAMKKNQVSGGAYGKVIAALQ